jgi:cytochrome c556
MTAASGGRHHAIFVLYLSIMMIRYSVLLMLFLAGLTACGPVEDTRPGQPVKTRQTAFKEMLKVFEPMGTMLRTNKYDPQQFVALAEALMTKRDAPWRHFAADTHYPPTKAKPDVWAKAEQFERERLAFMTATDQLLVAARAKRLADVQLAYQLVADACQSCHKNFREK